MSAAGEKVYLVAVYVEPVKPEPGQRPGPKASNHLYASAESAGEGLRESLDE